MDIKELVIVGEAEIGKTTLANALLGWDIFPQTNDSWYIPTKENASQMLTEHMKLTDTPGYDLWYCQVPEAVTEAVARADIILMMFKGIGTEENMILENAEDRRRWLERLAKEEKLQRDLLEKAKTRDIYFVIPFYSEDGPVEQGELEWELSCARERFASLSDHGAEGFFCVDPMMALKAAIEDDRAALEKSGIIPLMRAVTETA